MNSNTRNVDLLIHGAGVVAEAYNNEFITPAHILFVLINSIPMKYFLESFGEEKDFAAANRALRKIFRSQEMPDSPLKISPIFSQFSIMLLMDAYRYSWPKFIDTEISHEEYSDNVDISEIIVAFDHFKADAKVKRVWDNLFRSIKKNYTISGQIVAEDTEIDIPALPLFPPDTFEEFNGDGRENLLSFTEYILDYDSLEEWEALSQARKDAIYESLMNELEEIEEPAPSDKRGVGEVYQPSGSGEEEIDDMEMQMEEDWHSMVIDVHALYSRRNPLIGRDEELDRTIQILCRKDKNNPLHLGEPGVGKTALIYGLARRIDEKKVPESLWNAHIYQLDMAAIVAGTQYRGDFEKKLQRILNGASSEPAAILYIDEIHTIHKAGAVDGGSLDAGNILKRYLEDGQIRFIGATTFEEHKKILAGNQALMRRFQTVEVAEPSIAEAITILKQLKKDYEKFHGVKFEKGVIEYAVEMSARHIHDRFLPDKAIDLLDEAGAYVQTHPESVEGKKVTKPLISRILSKLSRVEALDTDKEKKVVDTDLGSRIRAQVYGQDKVVEDVVESILMSKAGLGEEGKPLGSFLFVGPTGVGKTELSKMLAKEMGVELVRFDMSEFAEKHSVAKLIGSPAGYVGYEDGGLLTDAVRRNPGCVLLLDEIEKAHPEIYNILLQVMDYGVLTDNKGRKASFNNVVLLMTSNAGAQFASQAGVGFGNTTSKSKGMLQEVRRVFKPEFLNRLSGIELFNDMDDKMSRMILDKTLHQLEEKLAVKKVNINISTEAVRLLLTKGFNQKYGARELQRVIEKELKRPLSKEILFGKLKKGGVAEVDAKGNEIIIDCRSKGAVRKSGEEISSK